MPAPPLHDRPPPRPARLFEPPQSAFSEPSLQGPKIRLCAPLFAALFTLFTALFALFTPTFAAAHGKSVSYSSWEIGPEEAVVTLRLKLLEISRLGPEALPPGSTRVARPAGRPDLAARAFPRELVMLADGVPCPTDPIAQRRPDAPEWVRYQWRVRCPADAQSKSIRSQLLLAVAPSHLHFARVHDATAGGDSNLRNNETAGGDSNPGSNETAGGDSNPGSSATPDVVPPALETVRERVLTEAHPEFVLTKTESAEAPASQGSDFFDYLRLGIEHILSGWDHLAFVFGLLLLSTRLGEVARLITGFTLAHSLTLALAVLGWVHPKAAAVEAVIAFSVALVALEMGWQSAGRPRLVPALTLVGLSIVAALSLTGSSTLPLLTVAGLLIFTYYYFALAERSQNSWRHTCLTFAFGLVHGFGFAGILVEMTLPTERLAPAVLGFNLGVEVGQIGVVFLLWPILSLLRRASRPQFTRIAGELATASLCGLGLYWFVERAFA